MKNFLSAFFAISTLATLDASAVELTHLHASVKTKLEKYCPQELGKVDIDALRTEEILQIDKIDYFADERKKIPTIENEKLTLCSGKYAQNRSNPGRVDCSYCKEDEKKPLLTINVHVTKDVDEALAKREEDSSEISSETA